MRIFCRNLLKWWNNLLEKLLEFSVILSWKSVPACNCRIRYFLFIILYCISGAAIRGIRLKFHKHVFFFDATFI